MAAIYDAMTGAADLFVNNYITANDISPVKKPFGGVITPSSILNFYLSSFAFQVFVVDDLAHWFCIYFAFDP